MHMPTNTPTKYCINAFLLEMFGGKTYPAPSSDKTLTAVEQELVKQKFPFKILLAPISWVTKP